MTLLRIIVVLVSALLLLIAVVIQRADTTRLHNEISRCEREADDLRLELREAELELARLRNPDRIRQRMEATIGQPSDPSPPEPGARRTGQGGRR
jgi:cell division protein FtsL